LERFKKSRAVIVPHGLQGSGKTASMKTLILKLASDWYPGKFSNGISYVDCSDTTLPNFREKVRSIRKVVNDNVSTNEFKQELIAIDHLHEMIPSTAKMKEFCNEINQLLRKHNGQINLVLIMTDEEFNLFKNTSPGFEYIDCKLADLTPLDVLWHWAYWTFRDYCGSNSKAWEQFLSSISLEIHSWGNQSCRKTMTDFLHTCARYPYLLNELKKLFNIKTEFDFDFRISNIARQCFSEPSKKWPDELTLFVEHFKCTWKKYCVEMSQQR